MASIGPKAGSSHTSLKYHTQKRHLEDGESGRGARTQLSCVQGHRTTGGGQRRFTGLQVGFLRRRQHSGCVTRAVTCGSGAPRPSFRRTPGKQSKGKNLAANDRASRIRPIFASQARLSFFFLHF